MASKKKSYAERGKHLISLGLLPKKYNTTTESGKRHIRRIELQLKKESYGNEILTHAAEAFLGVKTTARGARALREKGYITRRVGNSWRAFFSRQHAESAVYDSRDGTLTRIYPNRRLRAYPMDTPAETERRLERFFGPSGESGDDKWITFQIGNHAPFFRTIHSMEDFHKYQSILLKEFRSRLDSPDSEGRKDAPIEFLQIVYVNRAE